MHAALRTLALFAAMLPAAVPAHAGTQSEVFLTLRASAQVDGRSVRVGDIATVATRDPAEQARWKALEAAKLRSLAAPVRLSREEISGQIALAHPELAVRILWGGSNEVLVSGKSQTVNLGAGIDGAAMLLMARQNPADRIAVKLVDNAGGTATVPVGKVKLVPDGRAIRNAGGLVEIPLNVEVDGAVAAAPLLRFSVARAPRGNPAAMPMAMSEVPASTEAPQVPAIESSAPAQRVPAGAAYAVARNQPISIVIDDGGIRIESEGVALENARQGDSVKVRRTSNQLELVGRVVQSGVVLVETN